MLQFVNERKILKWNFKRNALTVANEMVSKLLCWVHLFVNLTDASPVWSSLDITGKIPLINKCRDGVILYIQMAAWQQVIICRYHMFGEDVYRLRVLLRPSQPELTEVVLFHKEGNFGDNWNYAQITLNLSTESTVRKVRQSQTWSCRYTNSAQWSCDLFRWCLRLRRRVAIKTTLLLMTSLWDLRAVAPPHRNQQMYLYQRPPPPYHVRMNLPLHTWLETGQLRQWLHSSWDTYHAH